MGTLIKTSLSKNYVKSWGLKEGIREIVQNAMDADDKGSQMEIIYNPEKERLVIQNDGAYLHKSDFLMGSTVKTDDDKQRGSHGEGFKVGALALVRIDKPVTIINGPKFQTYEAYIVFDEDYKEHVLAFNLVEKAICHDKLIFVIEKITLDEWNSLKSNFLSISPPENTLQTDKGDILLDEELKGNIYCGGLFVNHSKELHYGYDFKPSILKLNRDRNLTDWFDVRWNTSQMWSNASTGETEVSNDIYNMLSKSIPDVEYIDNFLNSKLKKDVASIFTQETSNTSYPVTSNSESKDVTDYGYDAVISSNELTEVLKQEIGTIDDIKRVSGLRFTEVQLSIEQGEKLSKAIRIFNTVDEFEVLVKIVKFEFDSPSTVIDDIFHISEDFVYCEFELLHEIINLFCRVSNHMPTHVWKRIIQNNPLREL